MHADSLSRVRTDVCLQRYVPCIDMYLHTLARFAVLVSQHAVAIHWHGEGLPESVHGGLAQVHALQTAVAMYLTIEPAET